MKTVSFAGFTIKVLRSSLIPPTKIYAIVSRRNAKNFIAILEAFDNLIKGDKIRLIVKKQKGRIIKPS